MSLRKFLLPGSLVLLAVLAGLILFRPKVTTLGQTSAATASVPAAVRVPDMSLTTGPVIDWDQRIAQARASEFPELMDQILQLTDSGLRRRLIGTIFARWIREDSRAMTAYFDRLEVNRSLASLALCYEALQDQLTRLDPSVEADDTVLVLIDRLVAHLSVTDPEKALVWAERYLLEDTLQNALANIAAGTARQDEKRALEIADQIISPLRRSQALANIGVQWAARDGAAALKWAEQLEAPGERGLAVNSVLLVMARKNLTQAADSLSSNASELTADYVEKRKATLAAANLTEADLANDTEAYRDMMENGAIPGPNSPDAELLSEAGKVIATRLAAGDAPEAVKWADSLDSAYLRLTALSGAMETWAATDPVAAVDYIIGQQFANPALLDSAYAAWAKTNPAAAAEGVSRIENPLDRSALLNTVVKSWAAGPDAAAAVTWLNIQPAATVPDSMKVTVAASLAERSPAEAWKIASGIQNPSAQARSLSQVFSYLIFQDTATASTLLRTASLPRDTSERLSEMLEAVGAKN